ncbi:hypothetical protein [Eisenibacter elegans]|uniref:hypothetical protein n=1 Tax=Eisenibacter elegans TaxID=997 RepID=UPI0004029D04|nr:hypothetical protein [Eisenibacter elegans]
MSIQIFPLLYKNEGKKIGIRTYPDATLKARRGELKYSKTIVLGIYPTTKSYSPNSKLSFKTCKSYKATPLSGLNPRFNKPT